jgi:DNA-binding NtrC family response regulator
MTQEISNVYAPVLTLLLNTVYERILEKELDQNAAIIRAMKPQRHLQQLLQRIAIGEWGFPDQSASRSKKVAVRFEPHMFNRSLSALGALCRTTANNWEAITSKLSFLEKGLLELWSERKSRALSGRQTLRDTLLFSKYFVASPSLVQQVQKAVRLRHQKSKPGPNVVSALVIGGPGSGKDTMAKLIWLFSPGFRFGGIRTLNMAMFRPKELAVPLLLGLNANEGSTADSIGPFQLDGVLLRAMRSHEPPPNPTTQSRRTVSESTTAKGFTFILDELNSLDIDTQGALLRVLENAELTPLGGMNNPIQTSERTPVIPTCASDILIIGIMNEDPHLIMKRQAMDRILQQSELFGTILGQTLHELLRSQRRLRDDLYYRLIRGGEIIMPTLTQRIEDIPILVYNTISRFNDLFPDNLKEVEVELKVYDLLMDPSLKWEGNLRELQTITRSIVMEAKARFEKHKKFDLTPPARFIIRGTDARRALQVYQKPLAHAGSVG